MTPFPSGIKSCDSEMLDLIKLLQVFNFVFHDYILMMKFSCNCSNIADILASEKSAMPAMIQWFVLLSECKIISEKNFLFHHSKVGRQILFPYSNGNGKVFKA